MLLRKIALQSRKNFFIAYDDQKGFGGTREPLKLNVNFVHVCIFLARRPIVSSIRFSYLPFKSLLLTMQFSVFQNKAGKLH